MGNPGILKLPMMVLDITQRPTTHRRPLDRRAIEIDA
jgi:hypothetical protein